MTSLLKTLCNYFIVVLNYTAVKGATVLLPLVPTTNHFIPKKHAPTIRRVLSQMELVQS